jgi:hypothetical protein
LPTYSPDYNPIEQFWKKIKQQDTHLHSFPPFETFTEKVEQALLKLSNAPEEILALCSLPIELDQAAQCIYHTIFFLNAIDRLLNEATQQTELAKAIDLYKKAQRLALENLWSTYQPCYG